jgi:hypothetical protein
VAEEEADVDGGGGDR